MYGLLNKKDDTLIFECINKTLLILDPIGESLPSVYATSRIDMQFDFRGKIF